MKLMPLTAFALSTMSCAMPLRAATPEPVQPGLWEAHVVSSFQTEGAQATSLSPHLPKPQESTYKICIGEARARSPMGEPNAKGLVSSDSRGYLFRDTVPGPQGESQVESSYRRIDAHAFEGRQVVGTRMEQQATTMRMSIQYSARWLAADCGALKPGVPSKFGAP